MNKPAFGVSLVGADPVATAIRAERLGFDFVSAPDHPAANNPSPETWTLLTWIAASTTHIAVATKVLAVPFRSPAITAKMAETLDRLSAGRLILGLGAGYSNQEIDSLGIQPRTAGERIDGLEDAIRIIRGLWSEPEFSHRGKLHHVQGARIEPKPAHPIPIWLGTFGKRALALTGRLADGWIPSLGYAPPQVVGEMRDRVLTAAQKAGRDPEEITCAYHMELRIDERTAERTSIVTGTPDAIIERLTGFLRLGFTAMNFSLLGPDENEQLERLATEVLPALRGAIQ
jgi:probable F420-dependent oxidoreductase